MKTLLALLLLIPNFLNAENLVSKNTLLLLNGLETMESMFEEIEQKFGENWSVAWDLDSYRELQETCEPYISILKNEMNINSNWNGLYASLLIRGVCPEIKQNTKQGIDLLKDLAGKGDETAQRDLGIIYETGNYGFIKDIVEININTASKYYLMAINQHNEIHSARKYSNLLVNSNKINNDYELAFEILEKAASKNVSIFEKDDIYVQLYLLPIQIFMKQYERINKNDDKDLVSIQTEQLLVSIEPYYNLSLKVLINGAESGSTTCMALLSDMLVYLAVPIKEPTRIAVIHSYMWSNIALEVDNRESIKKIAREARDYAEANLSLDDIIIAQNLTRNWLPGSKDYYLVE